MLIRLIIALPIVAILLSGYWYSARYAKIKHNQWIESIEYSLQEQPLPLVTTVYDDNIELPVEQAIDKIVLSNNTRIKI